MRPCANAARPLLCGLAFGLLAPHAAVAGEAPSVTPTAAGPVLTGKERLSGKGADEQRVDNCKVPADRRDTKERPDLCGGASATATQ